MFNLSVGRISEIPFINKILVVGFINEIFLKMKYQHLPQLILQLCLLFFNPCVDEWDAENVDESIQITGLIAERLCSCVGYKSVLLSNVVSSGIHSWKFKFLHCEGYNEIGIVPVTEDFVRLSSISHYSYINKTYYERFIACTGISYPFASITENDVVEMTINFAKESVTFSANGVFISVTRIHSDKYRAVVTLGDIGEKIELIGYQHAVIKM